MNTPSGFGGAGARLGGGAGQNGDGSAFGGRKRQATAGGQVMGAMLAPAAHDHGAGRPAAQGLFRRRQQGRGVPDADQKDVGGGQPPGLQSCRIGRSGFVPATTFHDPDQGACRGPQGQGQGEAVGGRSVCGRSGVNLVQGMSFQVRRARHPQVEPGLDA